MVWWTLQPAGWKLGLRQEFAGLSGFSTGSARSMPWWPGHSFVWSWGRCKMVMSLPGMPSSTGLLQPLELTTTLMQFAQTKSNMSNNLLDFWYFFHSMFIVCVTLYWLQFWDIFFIFMFNEFFRIQFVKCKLPTLLQSRYGSTAVQEDKLSASCCPPQIGVTSKINNVNIVAIKYGW